MIDPLTGYMLATGIGGALGGIFGGSASRRAEREYQDQINALLSEYDTLQAPNIQSLLANYINPESNYNYETQTLGQSAMNDVAVDPEIMANLNLVQDQLKQRMTMGLTPEDLQARNQIMQQIANQRKSALAQNEQDSARRGMANSGSAEIQRMMSIDQAQQAGQQQADELASQNFQAKMGALSSLGEFSGNRQTQDWNQKQQVASANDVNDQFSAQWLNQASKDKAMMAQNMANTRANTYNSQQDANVNAYQNDFNNRRNIMSDRMNLQSGAAAQGLQFGQNQAQNRNNIWSGMGQAAGAGTYAYLKNPTPLFGGQGKPDLPKGWNVGDDSIYDRA